MKKIVDQKGANVKCETILLTDSDYRFLDAINVESGELLSSVETDEQIFLSRFSADERYIILIDREWQISIFGIP